MQRISLTIQWNKLKIVDPVISVIPMLFSYVYKSRERKEVIQQVKLGCVNGQQKDDVMLGQTECKNI